MKSVRFAVMMTCMKSVSLCCIKQLRRVGPLAIRGYTNLVSEQKHTHQQHILVETG